MQYLPSHQRLLVAFVFAAACSGGSSGDATDGQGGAGGDGGGPGITDGEPAANGTPCTPGELLPARLVRLGQADLQRHIELSLGTVSANVKLANFHLQGEQEDLAQERGISSSDFVGLRNTFAEAAAAVGNSLPAESPCRKDDAGAACRDTVFKPLVARLYRRQPDKGEWDAIVATHTALTTSHGASGAFLGALQGALLSPQVMYRDETGPLESSGDRVRLTNRQIFDLASFGFLGRFETADANLIEASEKDFAKQFAERLSDWGQRPEFKSRVADFFGRWLAVRYLPGVERASDAFTPQAKEAMVQEFRAFILDNLLADDGDVERFFLASESKQVPALDPFYEGTATTQGGVRKWDETKRRGLLGLPAVLATHAAATASDPVQRGMLVRLRLMCEPMPAPIPNADFGLVKVTEEMTTRERFDSLAQATACAACHKVINPVGYLFESFDQVGRYRTEEKGKPIDNSGTIPPFFDDPAYEGVQDWQGTTELSAWLGKSPQVRRCMARNFAEFMLADVIAGGANSCAVSEFSSRFSKSGRFGELVADLVTSSLFSQRSAN